MGITQRLGTIPLAIQTDTSNNVGIGAAPSGTYKLEVTGTAKVSTSAYFAIASGSVGIGTITPTSYFFSGNGLAIYNATQNTLSIATDTNGTSSLYFSNGASGAARYNGYLEYIHSTNSMTFGTGGFTRLTLASTGAATFSSSVTMGGDLVLTPNDSAIGFSSGAGRFFTGGTERMRITNGGLFKFQNNGSSYESSTAGVNEFNTAANDTNVVFRNTAATLTGDRAGIDVFYTTASPNNSSAAFYQAADNSSGRVLRFQVTSNGYVHSRSTSIVIISSDENLKKDITDYDKGLSEVLAMKPRYYRYKAEPEKLQIGFIAQEMDAALEGSMIDSPEKNKETGESYKTYHLEWYPLLVNAIKEQQATITSLQDRLDKAGL